MTPPQSSPARDAFRSTARRSTPNLARRAAAAIAVVATLGVFAVGVSSSSAAGQVVSQTFTPVADAFVSSSSPTTNYGAASMLKTDASPVLTTYLRFDVSNLAGSVTRATLQVYARTNTGVGLDARAVSDTTWSESSLTYENAPAFASIPSASARPVKPNRWTTFDVTPLISGNGAVSIALTTRSMKELDFDSREGANSPTLTV